MVGNVLKVHETCRKHEKKVFLCSCGVIVVIFGSVLTRWLSEILTNFNFFARFFSIQFSIFTQSFRKIAEQSGVLNVIQFLSRCIWMLYSLPTRRPHCKLNQQQRHFVYDILYDFAHFFQFSTDFPICFLSHFFPHKSSFLLLFSNDFRLFSLRIFSFVLFYFQLVCFCASRVN